MKHDKGIINLKTFSRSKKTAVEQVLRAEGAPKSAVLSVKKNPFTRVKYPSRSARLFRAKKTGRWGAFRRKNPASGPADETAARELQLFIENDAELYRQQFTPILLNLLRKMKAGKYNHALAPRLWLYLVDNGAHKYTREFGSEDALMPDLFNLNTRRLVAQRLADEQYQRMKDGEYSQMLGQHQAKARASRLIQGATRKGNPLTRRETMVVLKASRNYLRDARNVRHDKTKRALLTGQALGGKAVARVFGKMGGRASFAFERKASRILSNPLNPRRGGSEMPRLYASTHSITMRKGKDSAYPGQNFEHTFSKSNPVENFGIPAGTTIILPSGWRTRVTTKSVLLTGKKDIWGLYRA